MLVYPARPWGRGSGKTIFIGDGENRISDDSPVSLLPSLLVLLFLINLN